MPVARGLSQGDEVRSWRGLGDLGCHLASDLFNSLHKLQELCQGEDIGDKGCEVEPKCPCSCQVRSWQVFPALSLFSTPPVRERLRGDGYGSSGHGKDSS